MASSSVLNNESTIAVGATANKTISIHPLNRSIERALDEASYTGEIQLNSRKLRDFPNVTSAGNKHDLSDTVAADLSRNRFTEFPRILCTFFSLERLNLYHNAIKSIPEEIVQIHMLKVLDLSRNQLAFIPAALCQLPNLEVLTIQNNKLVSLPEEIGNLKKLIELDVSSNDITQLPFQIGCLCNLRTLNVRRNMIIELPNDLCALKLNYFDCSYNRLTRLPLNLREMVSLIELNVENNPLELPPASVCTLGLLHIMRCLLVEAMKDEKRRGLLTEHEINEKYRNSFNYQFSRHSQNGLKMRKSVAPSDSGYLTTEGSEKTIGDDDSSTGANNENGMMFNLADEFSKELARQKAEYEKKKCQAQQLKRHLLQQLGETEIQRAKAREIARRTHDEKLAKMEKQREDARRKMENSKQIQLLNFSSKEEIQKMRENFPTTRGTLTRHFSNTESSTKSKKQVFSTNSSKIFANETPSSRTNRSFSVEPNLNGNCNEFLFLSQQRSLGNGSAVEFDDSPFTTNPCTSSSETMDQSSSPSPKLVQSPKNGQNSSRLTKLRFFDERPTSLSIPGFHMQPRVSTKGFASTSIEQPESNPAFTIRRQILQVKEDLIQLEQMKKTIEDRVKVTLPDDLGFALSDGVVLCHFINQIRARAVQSIHVPSQAVPRLSLAKCRRNVENFIEASRRLGVPEEDLCTAQDIIEEKNTVRLARHVQLLVSPESYEQTNV